jgi:hypothetical protein
MMLVCTGGAGNPLPMRNLSMRKIALATMLALAAPLVLPADAALAQTAAPAEQADYHRLYEAITGDPDNLEARQAAALTVHTMAEYVPMLHELEAERPGFFATLTRALTPVL